jgi:hypothetical protein
VAPAGGIAYPGPATAAGWSEPAGPSGAPRRTGSGASARTASSVARLATVAPSTPAAAPATAAADALPVWERSPAPPASRPNAVSGSDRAPGELSVELFAGSPIGSSTLSMSASDGIDESFVSRGDDVCAAPISATERD